MLGVFVQRNDIDLGRDPADQTSGGTGIIKSIVEAVNQNVFEGDPPTALEGERSQRSHHVVEPVSTRDRHDALASGLVWRVQRQRQLGSF